MSTYFRCLICGSTTGSLRSYLRCLPSTGDCRRVEPVPCGARGKTWITGISGWIRSGRRCLSRPARTLTPRPKRGEGELNARLIRFNKWQFTKYKSVTCKGRFCMKQISNFSNDDQTIIQRPYDKCRLKVEDQSRRKWGKGLKQKKSGNIQNHNWLNKLFIRDCWTCAKKIISLKQNQKTQLCPFHKYSSIVSIVWESIPK